MSAPLYLAASQQPGTITSVSPSRSRCSDCKAPSSEDHAPWCNAPLAICPRCSRPQVLVTPSTRPTLDALDRACPKCGNVVTLPASFARRDS